VVGAVAAVARLQIIFEVGGIAQRCGGRFHGFLGQGRAAQVRVQHRACQIEDAALRRPHLRCKPHAAPLGDFGVGRAGIGSAQFIKHVAHGSDDRLPAMAIRQRHDRRCTQDAVDGGQRCAGIGGRRFRHHVTEIRMLLRGAGGAAF
jgi:hypothetical protein